jgi:hypothetical protein
MTLPREIRDLVLRFALALPHDICVVVIKSRPGKIWHALLPSSEPSTISSYVESPDNNHNIPTSLAPILFTSSQLYHECLPHFFSLNTFYLHDAFAVPLFCRWLSTVHPHQLPNIRRIALDACMCFQLDFNQMHTNEAFQRLTRLEYLQLNILASWIPFREYCEILTEFGNAMKIKTVRRVEFKPRPVYEEKKGDLGKEMRDSDSNFGSFIQQLVEGFRTQGRDVIVSVDGVIAT